MQALQIYDQKKIDRLTRKRTGEIKLGELVAVLGSTDLSEGLKNSAALFVLLGIPEDIGVRANFGRSGADSAWNPALSNILNLQHNSFLNGNDLLVLGEIHCEDLIEKAEKLSSKIPQQLKQLRTIVAELDVRVSFVIEQICAAGKIPIVIGGGHNNAYGNIKGAALGLFHAKKTSQAKLNCINSDAHADFRPMEGRHSGNGFRYAFEEGFLESYAIVGLHESFNSQEVLTTISNNSSIDFSTFESILIREEMTFMTAVMKAIDFTGSGYCGIELDMDTIQNMPSSAKTSSGISANQARQFVYWCAKNAQTAYLHIAEAAPVLSHIKTDNKTGKLIAYLVSDFIKGYKQQHPIQKPWNN